MFTFRSLDQREKASTKNIERQCAVSHSRILVSKKDGTPALLFPYSEPVLSSAKSSWTGLLVEQHHMPPTEFPERTATTHQLVMHFRPATLGWFLGEHPQTVRIAPGSINIVPQGTLLVLRD